jgi:hypothetical protein
MCLPTSLLIQTPLSLVVSKLENSVNQILHKTKAKRVGLRLPQLLTQMALE